MSNLKEYKVCSNCVMDTTDTNIVFDENGVCGLCNEFEKRISHWWNNGKGHEKELEKIILDIKQSGKDKPYDCLLGLSGGTDSSFLLHMAVKEWGLRPFVLHVDAGWDLPIAVSNITNLCNKLNVQLHVEKIDFEDMRNMQLAFFATGHAGLDAPQDHAFIAQVDHYAEKLGIKYILNGFNIATEAFQNPASWYKGAGPTADKTYIKDVLKKHGGYKPKNYLYTTGFRHKFWLPYVKGVKTVTLLNYIPITKYQVEKTLINEYGFVPYDQKHFEDLLTKFIEGWWLPTRFGYDIRKVWLSSLVVTGQMKREEALEILKNPPLTEEESKCLFKEVANKLNISEEELLKYHRLPKRYKKYRSNQWMFDIGIKIYNLLGLEKRVRQ